MANISNGTNNRGTKDDPYGTPLTVGLPIQELPALLHGTLHQGHHRAEDAAQDLTLEVDAKHATGQTKEYC